MLSQAFHFSVVIENIKADYYFSAKLINCFVHGVVPVYPFLIFLINLESSCSTRWNRSTALSQCAFVVSVPLTFTVGTVGQYCQQLEQRNVGEHAACNRRKLPEGKTLR
jgi:hypothetical protein